MIACRLSEVNLGCAAFTSCVKSLCALGALQMLTKACQLSAIWRRFKQIIYKVGTVNKQLLLLTDMQFPVRLCSLIIFKGCVFCSQLNEIFWINFNGGNKFRKLLWLGHKRKKTRRRKGGIAIFLRKGVNILELCSIYSSCVRCEA